MRIRAYATLRELLGGGILDQDVPPGLTVGDVLAELAARYPAFGKKLWHGDGRSTGFVTVLLNGRSIEYLKGEASPITSDDVLSLFPPVGGG